MRPAVIGRDNVLSAHNASNPFVFSIVWSQLVFFYKV